MAGNDDGRDSEMASFAPFCSGLEDRHGFEQGILNGRLKIATLDVPAFLERSSLMPKKQVTGAHISPFQIENQSWRRPLNLLS